MQKNHGTQHQRYRRVANRRSSLPAFSRNHNNNYITKLSELKEINEQLKFSEGVGPLPDRRVSLTSMSTNF